MTVKVMIVDDSAVVRCALSEVLNRDPDIEVVATAHDPYDAVRQLRIHRPDVMTLDIEMPKMDGLTFLEKLMKKDPLPVVMCSSLTAKGAKASLDALELGAVDVIQKPRTLASAFFEEESLRLCEAIKDAAKARVHRVELRSPHLETNCAADGSGLRASTQAQAPRQGSSDRLIVVGSSTGGTEALRVLLASLPADSPPLAVVQHMPAAFTGPFAARLNAQFPLQVTEAVHGARLGYGDVAIAPGDRHMLVHWVQGQFEIELRDGPLICRHRPSVDVLFRSAAKSGGRRVAAAILTGMGKDGARGMLDLFRAGAATLAQDEASSVVFGMPGSAIELGGVKETVPLQAIGPRLLALSEQPLSRTA